MKLSITTALFVTGLVIAVPLADQAAMPAAAQKAIDGVLDDAVARSLVPGMAVAIVRDGRVIYERNVGLMDLDNKRPVAADTLFYIASCTKSFTALATVLMDRAGVLKLDSTLAEILPEARLAPGLDPAKITVRQLLTHTHGIAGDGPLSYRAAYSGEIERAAMLRALTAHGPAPNGTAYSYSNVGYNILSLAIDRLAKQPWQDVLAERVYKPLGLTSTSARVSTFPLRRLALPYRPDPKGLAPMPYGKQDPNMQAAGGMLSTTRDLARYITMLMDAGMIDGRRVFPADVIEETLKVHARFTAQAGIMARDGYALGWNTATLDGERIMQHGGGFPGFSANLSFMPGRRIGIAIVGNGGYSPQFQDLVMGYAYALLTGNEGAVAKYQQQIGQVEGAVAKDRQAMEADRARRAARPQTTALPFSAYTGRFVNEIWGSIVVTVRDGRVYARNGVLESVAEVYDGEKHALRVEIIPGQGVVLQFVENAGKLVAVTYAGQRFERVQ